MNKILHRVGVKKEVYNMGHSGIYKCKDCGNEFKAQEGGGYAFIEYRCVNCDAIKDVFSNRGVSPEDYKPPTKKKIGVCEKCGGELRDDIRPMCPKCKSRNVKEQSIFMYYD
jgi:ABC-type ATPase with predicted acetyltransferase domain